MDFAAFRRSFSSFVKPLWKEIFRSSIMTVSFLSRPLSWTSCLESRVKSKSINPTNSVPFSKVFPGKVWACRAKNMARAEIRNVPHSRPGHPERFSLTPGGYRAFFTKYGTFRISVFWVISANKKRQFIKIRKQKTVELESLCDAIKMRNVPYFRF